MRYVIQHHICEHEHYDLMIENDDALSTWSITPGNLAALLNGNRIEATRIQDHRKDYLKYEGPVSDDRGRVEIYDSGDCEMDINFEDDDRCFVKRMNGGILKGIVRIQEQGDIFIIEYTPDDRYK